MAGTDSWSTPGSTRRGSEETEKTTPNRSSAPTPSNPTAANTSAAPPAPVTPAAPTESANPAPQTYISRTKQHLYEPVELSLCAEIELLILTFCTGIQDAISFPDYNCFASNQTGNTVFLAVALVVPELNGHAFHTANILVALSLFLAGGAITGQLAHVVGARRRYWLLVCNFLSTALVFIAAALQHLFGVEETGPLSLGVIALLAFASGSQVVQSRSLACTEITTAMATAAWIDLLMDPRVLTLKPNRPRNRRLGFLLMLIAGSLVGAGIYRTAGSAAALFMSAGGKAVVTGMFWFNPPERVREQQEAV
ncbi:unnamed protein product [Discula destructiva]